jgi:hypothetical protein
MNPRLTHILVDATHREAVESAAGLDAGCRRGRPPAAAWPARGALATAIASLARRLRAPRGWSRRPSATTVRG